MRIAILSALEKTDEGTLCASLPYLGASVFAKQCETALAFGAERIICLTQDHDPAILEAQHRLEVKGIDFHIVSNSLAMIGLIRADDDLVLIADSLLVDPAKSPSKLIKGRGIVSIASDVGEAERFERIDANRYWGGLLVAKGAIATQLAELPRDSDIISLLLRLALQARTPILELDSGQTGALFKATNPALLDKHEKLIFAEAVPKSPWSGVGGALAKQCISALGPRVFGRGHWVAAAVAACGCILGIVLSTLNHAVPAMFSLFVGVFAAHVLRTLNVMRARLSNFSSDKAKLRYLDLFVDGSIAISLVLIHLYQAPVSALFLAPLSIMALRVATFTVAQSQNPAVKALFADRLMLIVILAIGISLGHGLLTTAMVAALVLGFVLFWGARESIRQT